MARTESAAEVLAAARRREAARVATAKAPDWDALNRVIKGQRAALTRAVRSGSSDKLVLTVRDAVRKWNEIGVWPDDWSRWQCALDDALGFQTVDIAHLA